MKSFLKTVFAVLVGLFLAGFLSIFFIVGLIDAFAETEPFYVNPHSVLIMDLSKYIADKEDGKPWARMNWRNLKIPYQGTLYETVQAIEAAAEDENIDGMLLLADELNMSLNVADELRRAIEVFKASGKFVYAYAGSYDQRPYFMASVADSVFLHPSGEMLWRGFSSQHFYLKEALARFGVEPQIIRHGKYKSAVEPFMENEMSPANREQTERYLGSMWNYVVETVAKSRNTTVDRLQEFADKQLMFLAKEALAAGLVDRLLYKDELDELLRARTETEEDDDVSNITLESYAEYVSTQERLDLSREKIALVYASGEINDSDESDEEIGGYAYSKIFEELRKDKKIKAVVLRVNSPGGSAFASDVMWRELELLKKEKPLIVSMGQYAASGGYYISAPADAIVANPLTVTGSIGVFGMYFTYGKLLQEKLGVHPHVVNTNVYSDFGSVFRPMSELERRTMLHSVEEVYTDFLQCVASGRGKTTAEIDSVGQGRVWSGIDALELGLVDQLGTLEDAIALAAERAECEDNYRLSVYPKSDSDFMSQMLDQFSSIKMSLFRSLSPLPDTEQQLWDDVQRLISKRGVRAEIPYTIDIR